MRRHAPSSATSKTSMKAGLMFRSDIPPAGLPNEAYPPFSADEMTVYRSRGQRAFVGSWAGREGNPRRSVEIEVDQGSGMWQTACNVLSLPLGGELPPSPLGSDAVEASRYRAIRRLVSQRILPEEQLPKARPHEFHLACVGNPSMSRTIEGDAWDFGWHLTFAVDATFRFSLYGNSAARLSTEVTLERVTDFTSLPMRYGT